MDDWTNMARLSPCESWYNGSNERMTGATLARPPVRHRETRFSMLTQSPTFGDPRLPARFWAKVQIGTVPTHRPDLGPCWVWMASRKRGGYGQFGAGRRGEGMVYAHRFAYERLVGPIPDGLELDHICHNDSGCPGGPTCAHRRCVNLAHIKTVTHAENLRRGASAHRLLTHCPQGHTYSEANTYRWNNQRFCRTCSKRYKTAYQDRVRGVVRC